MESFRKTYSGPSTRLGSDPFAQLGKDTRQDRDDHGRQESSGGSRLNRPTQSSIAKGADNRAHRNSLSARSGRFTSLSQSVDLGPTLRDPGSAGKTNITRQPGLDQDHQLHHAPPSPPTLSAASTVSAHDTKPKLQEVHDSGQQREAVFMAQKRQLEASLHATNIRCNELARGLQQATAALDAERANVARLRTERDEHAADLAKARSQAAELQVSGSVALTTSEVCRAALSTAFKGTVSVIGSAHEELESALATQQQQQLELEAYQQRVDELEELALAQVEELEDARIKRRQLSEAMEELAERLQAREDELSHLMFLLVPSMKAERAEGSNRVYEAAAAQATSLTERVQQLEQQLAGQSTELGDLRAHLALHQEQMARMKERLVKSNSLSSSGGREGHQPADLETQVMELADGHEQLEADNLQLAAENEELRQEVSEMRECLQEALVTAAVHTAASDRDVSTAAEISRLQQQLATTAAATDDWRSRANAAHAAAAVAERRAEQSAGLLLNFSSQMEAARAQAEAARGALEAGRVEGQRLRGELEGVRAREAETRDEADKAWAKVTKLCAMVEALRAEAERATARAEAATERASLEVEQARVQGEERARASERERVEVLEARVAEQAARAQELVVEAGQLRSRVSELQEQLVVDSKASKEALEQQLRTVHANEAALLQRIQAGEAERHHLLQQIDEGNNALANMRHRVEEAAQQGAEVAALRGQVAELAVEVDRQTKAAVAAGARGAQLELEGAELRATLRATTELASQEVRVGERREAQLALLRQQLVMAEEQRCRSDTELRIAQAQVSVNECLRAQVDDLQARLAVAEGGASEGMEAAEAATFTTVVAGKTPCADVDVQADNNTADRAVIDVVTPSYGFGVSSSGGGGGGGTWLPPPALERMGSQLHGPIVVHSSPRSPCSAVQAKALAHAVTKQALVMGWLGGSGRSSGSVHFFNTEHLMAENLLASYNAIPEEDPEDGIATVSGRQGKGLSSMRRRGRSGKVESLRVVLKIVLKGTLMASGIALGLALGNPRANQMPAESDDSSNRFRGGVAAVSEPGLAQGLSLATQA